MQPKDPETLLDDPVGSLEISSRTANALDGAGVLTIRQLLSCCPRSASECRRYCACAGGRESFPA